MTMSGVTADGVRLSYGGTVALDGVDLRVPEATTLGVLGHNGAGKTSLIRVLTTALRPDGGQVRIDGVDAIRSPAEVRRRIGVTGQYAGLDDFLTAIENLELVARLSGLRNTARDRVRELVDRFELGDIAPRRVGELSGGSRRRVDLAASVVAAPRVLFLDEPTTGLDPAARHTVWTVIAELTAAGTTVILTTQYLEEADRLADQLAVLDGGRVVARGTPNELKRLVGGKVVKATVARDRIVGLPVRPVASAASADERTTLSFSVADDSAAADLIARLHADARGITDLEVASPSLDDVFFHLTQSGAAA
jgi:ABC-2 type transport system ATP-binding protein